MRLISGRHRSLTVPPAALTAGYHTLVFNSDFTNTNEVATTSGATTGAKWYWSGINSTSQFSINTGSGGILTLSGSAVTYADALQTLPGSLSGSTGAGTFNHGYFEARMQFGHLVAGAGGFAGWPSFWMFQSPTGPAANGVLTSEVDIMESYPSSGTVGSNSSLAHTMHNWLSSSGGGYTGTDEFNTNSNNYDSAHQAADDAYHIHGCLWTGNGTNCQISFYFDNILCTSPSSGGIQFFNYNTGMAMTAGMSALETAHMVMHLGCATTGWPVNVDWVHVFQAP